MKVQKCYQLMRSVALPCTLQHSKYYPGPAEPMGTVEICSHLILADSLNPSYFNQRWQITPTI
jgi:hypothetical protein